VIRSGFIINPLILICYSINSIFASFFLYWRNTFGGIFFPIRSVESSLRVLQWGKLANKKGPCFWHSPFPYWLPIVDEFPNFLMSEEADIIGYQIKDFSVLGEE